MPKAILGVIALLLVGCMNGDINGSSTVNGTYILRTVNGSPLPFTDPSSPSHKTILDDALSLYEGGTYAENGHIETTANGQTTTQTITASGSYSLFGNSITFTSNTNTTRLATGEGNSLTFVEAGVTSVYSK